MLLQAFFFISAIGGLHIVGFVWPIPRNIIAFLDVPFSANAFLAFAFFLLFSLFAARLTLLVLLLAVHSVLTSRLILLFLRQRHAQARRIRAIQIRTWRKRRKARRELVAKDTILLSVLVSALEQLRPLATTNTNFLRWIVSKIFGPTGPVRFEVTIVVASKCTRMLAKTFLRPIESREFSIVLVTTLTFFALSYTGPQSIPAYFFGLMLLFYLALPGLDEVSRWVDVMEQGELLAAPPRYAVRIALVASLSFSFLTGYLRHQNLVQGEPVDIVIESASFQGRIITKTGDGVIVFVSNGLPVDANYIYVSNSGEVVVGKNANKTLSLSD